MISINLTYYNEPIWFRYWYNIFKKFYLDNTNICLNICDDGSQKQPIISFFEKYPPFPNMRLFKVKEDIGFNSHGARNLLMQQTQTEWNLMTDIDRHYPLKTLNRIISEEAIDNLNIGAYYNLKELIRSSKDGFSVNDYVTSKTDFWKTGGYDEEFTNVHWGDRYFLNTLNMIAKRETREDWEVRYVRYARSVTYEDVPITQYPNDTSLIHPTRLWADQETRHGLKRLVQERNKTHEGRMSKKVINFEWEQVF